MPITIAQLSQKLISQAKINSLTHEKLATDDIHDILREALNQHDSSLGGDFSLLPDAHEELIILLAWIKVCYIRASMFTPDVDSARKGSGIPFGVDRSTPVDKNLKLAAALQVRYDLLRAKLEDDGALKSDIIQSNLFKRDPVTHTVSDTLNSLVDASVLNVEKPVLETDGSYSVILRWTRSQSYNFDRYRIYLSMNEGIYQDWNFNAGSTIVGIHDSAENVWGSSDRDRAAVKLTGLLPATTYYFVLVTTGRDQKHAYSNEESVLTA